MAGQFMKGALVELVTSAPPNVIIFQLNPETLRHTWTPPAAASSEPGTNPLAIRGMPGEAFSFTISLDATDQIAAGDPVAVATGVHARLAALEMLLFPVAAADQGLQAPAGAGAAGAASSAVPASQVPTVLFVWGPGRIVPVRLTGLTITERLYDPALNPTQAEAQLELRVLTSEELRWLTGPLAGVATAAYQYTQGRRQALTVANLDNAARSVIGMLPTSVLPT